MKIVFIGTSEFGIPALRALVRSKEHIAVAVVTQPDRPAGRGQKMTPSKIKEEALKLRLKIYQPEKIRQKSAIEQIRYHKPDVIVVAAYGQILPKEVLEIPTKACLNIHASLLPKYRGASPIQAALAKGDSETGVTIMWMDEGLDTGDILLQEKLTIRSHDTAGVLHEKLSELGAKALLKALDLIGKGKAPRVKQDNSQAVITKKLEKNDGEIDWNKTKREIFYHIRAMNPWPSAYTWVPDGNERKMLKIFSTIISRRAQGKPGEILRIDKHGILVAAKKGGLLLREVQLEGKKRMSAAEFARGFNLSVGALLQ